MTLPRTSYGLAAGLVIAAAIAWIQGGIQGLGTVLGYSLGAFLAFVAVAWQAHWLRVRSERVTRAQIEGFAIKFGALVLFAALLRFVEPLERTVSWQCFLLAYAAVTVLVLPLATWDIARMVASKTGRGSTLGTGRTA